MHQKWGCVTSTTTQVQPRSYPLPICVNTTPTKVPASPPGSETPADSVIKCQDCWVKAIRVSELQAKNDRLSYELENLKQTESHSQCEHCQKEESRISELEVQTAKLIDELKAENQATSEFEFTVSFGELSDYIARVATIHPAPDQKIWFNGGCCLIRFNRM